jgi:hypothetical protein
MSVPLRLTLVAAATLAALIVPTPKAWAQG